MISSTSNRQIKTIIQLNNKARARRELRAFVVEGAKLFSETPAALIEKVYVAEQFLEKEQNRVLLAKSGADYETVSDCVFAHASDTGAPQGILAVVHMPAYQFSDLLCGERTALLVLEDIQDPGNLGTMFRTAEGAGMSGIIMSRHTADLFAPKTVRATMGSIYRVPFYVSDDLRGTVKKLSQAGVHTYAAHLGGKCWYDEPDYTHPSAFLIGNEGNGLAEETAACADTLVKIPMEGRLESLNAGVAAGIFMYEAYRQRRALTRGQTTERKSLCVSGLK